MRAHARLLCRLAVCCCAAAAFPLPAAAQQPAAAAFWPEVSPDGRTVLYASPGRGGPIHAMNADGSSSRRIAAGTRAAWFPDGRHVLVVARSKPLSRLVMMRPDGSHPDTLPISSPPLLWRPRVSPDGTTIVFGKLGPAGLPNVFHLSRLDGTKVRDLHPSAEGQCLEPTWSHDGRLTFVAFERDTTDTIRSTTLYVMNADGSGERAVATLPDGAQWISWSPDDRRIALQDDDDQGNGNIVVVDVASGAVRVITHHDRPYFDETPSWAPDGHIFFQSNRSGTFAIYRMNADGTGQRRIVPR